MGRRAAWIILALCAACRSRDVPTASRGSSVGPTLGAQNPGAQISPQLAPLIEELGALRAITGQRVGSSAEPGPFFVLSQKFMDAGRASDFEAMVRYPEPIVRAMGLWGLAQQSNERATATILGHVRDPAPIDYNPIGCVVDRVPLGIFARHLLTDAHCLGTLGADSMDATAPKPSGPVPLLNEEQLWAIDLEIVATDGLAGGPFPSARRLSEAIQAGRLIPSLTQLAALSKYRDLALWQAIKALGRLEQTGAPTREFLIGCVHERGLDPLARLAAASALTRFADVTTITALEQERAFLDHAVLEPLAARLQHEARLRLEYERLMQPFREAVLISEIEPLADRVITASHGDHPFVLADPINSTSFGKYATQVCLARADAILQIAGRLTEFSQPWNTYSDTAQRLFGMLESGNAALDCLTDSQRQTVREHVAAVLADASNVDP
jgi:hypothetical protein